MQCLTLACRAEQPSTSRGRIQYDGKVHGVSAFTFWCSTGRYRVLCLIVPPPVGYSYSMIRSFFSTVMVHDEVPNGRSNHIREEGGCDAVKCLHSQHLSFLA